MVLNHFVEKNVIGTLAKPMMPYTALKRARRCGSSSALRNIKYATYRNSVMAVVVRRGSHVHHVFQTGRAHSIPDSSTITPKITPISAEAAARMSYLRCSP